MDWTALLDAFTAGIVAIACWEFLFKPALDWFFD